MLESFCFIFVLKADKNAVLEATYLDGAKRGSRNKTADAIGCSVSGFKKKGLAIPIVDTLLPYNNRKIINRI